MCHPGLRRAGVLARVTGDSKAEALFQECLTIREALAKDRKNERRRADLMLVLARTGEHARAAALADTTRGGTDRDPEVLVETARCYAGCAASTASDATLRSGYEQKAVKAVADAVASGYRDWVALETEPDLAPVRGMAEFRALVARVKPVRKSERGNK